MVARVFLILGLVILAPGCIDAWVDFLFGYKGFNSVIIPSIIVGVILFILVRAQRKSTKSGRA